jgi:hypothetical protein
VVAEIAQLYAINTPVNRNASLGVAQATLPLQVNVSSVWGQVMANLEHN